MSRPTDDRFLSERTNPTMDEAPIIYAVPVRDLPGRLGVRTVRTGRSPQGQQVGIAFTRPELLVTAMGADQQWEELCESALRGMLRPLGIEVIQVDPLLVAPPLEPKTVARPIDAPGAHPTGVRDVRRRVSTSQGR
ncbi:SAV_915 family protein [Micromonospora sp. A202]|uniref:SAV_915 family protein n=1 Tax=Micromonospora sp. A202 TaxID=2572899 RepID=UPI0011502031|nr:SAV_915 family protein [Micromonospora sp. A202]